MRTRTPPTSTASRSRPGIAATHSWGRWAASWRWAPTRFEEASVTTGSSSAEFGNAKSGIVSIVTKTGGSEYQGSLGFESDEPFGVNNGIGFNRVEGGFSGPLAGRLTFALNGTLEGRKALEDGMNSQDFPIFLQAGVDTVINQPSVAADDPTTPFDETLTADTTRGQRLQLRGQPWGLRCVRRRGGGGARGGYRRRGDPGAPRTTTTSTATGSACRPARGRSIPSTAS